MNMQSVVTLCRPEPMNSFDVDDPCALRVSESIVKHIKNLSGLQLDVIDTNVLQSEFTGKVSLICPVDLSHKDIESCVDKYYDSLQAS